MPDIIQALRENIYPPLVPIVNLWMKALKIEKTFPESYQAFQAECHASNQLKPTPLLLKYGEGGFNTLHQDLCGEVYFPLQAVFILSQPDTDFTGGEFVLTQQTPRAQSKAIVLNPDRGDIVIFATNFRPAEEAKGYYRVIMKHGVSEVRSGNRYALGIIFHDAVS